MIYKIRYTPAAAGDISELYEDIYRASGSHDIAEEYVGGLMAEIASVKEFPASGIPLQYRELFTGFYSVNYKKYKAFYRVRGEYIEVLRVIMARRDYIAVLFDK